MAGIIIVGDMCTGHGNWPARKVTAGTNRMTVGGVPVCLVGAPLEIHKDPTDPDDEGHAANIIEGSPLLTIDGIQVALDGAKVSCGGAMVSSSPLVSIG